MQDRVNDTPVQESSVKDSAGAKIRAAELQADISAGNARKPILFTHSDLDGAGCAIFFKSVFGKSAQVVFCHVSNVDARIREYLATQDLSKPRRFIFMADISPGPELAERLAQYDREGPGAMLLDHHVTASGLNRYPWAYVDPGACGALHMYRTLACAPAYWELADLIDDYDRWLGKDKRSGDLSQLCTLLGQSRFVRRFLTDPAVAFSANEELLITLENESRERLLNKVARNLTTIQLEGGGKLAVGYCDRYVSEISHTLIERFALDAIALIDTTSAKVSLRSAGELDIGSVAAALGGGGHHNAAGFANAVLESALKGVAADTATQICTQLHKRS